MRSLLCCLAVVLVFVATGRAQPMPTRDCVDTGDTCLETCPSSGRFQWCGACTHYLDCTTGFANYPLCPAGFVWNDNAGLCADSSPTCIQCVIPAAKCGGTGANCIHDCLGQLDGLYQYCGRCDYFLQCTNGATAYTKCQQDNLLYDDNFKACVAVSSTCADRPCSVPLGPCASGPCYNGGTCNDNGDGTYSCQCLPGYNGPRCENTICSPNPCYNGGTCFVQGGGWTCVCPPGWTGSQCQYPEGPCTPNPCLNGGVCIDNGGGSSSCSCPVGWTGSICESPNYQESCGSLLAWTNYPPQHGFTIFCVLEALEGSPNRDLMCRDTLQNLPMWSNADSLLAAGGNFGCIVSSYYPTDLEQTSFFACQNDYQQNVVLGEAVANHMMVCIHYPYEGTNATTTAQRKV